VPPLKNSQHEKLVYEIAMGCSHAEAARRAGYSPKTGKYHVHNILARKDVSARLEELRRITNSERVMSIAERKEELSRIARDVEKRRPQVAISAIAELNKMDGAYAPERFESTSQQVVVKTIEYFGPESAPPLEGPPATPRIAAP
jgi:phage terminase small subunit